MRKCAIIPQPASALKRLMIHEAEDGVYLFGFDTLEDSSCSWDEWHESVFEAEAAGERHGVAPGDWRIIPDPLPGCQQDWIAPVRLGKLSDGR